MATLIQDALDGLKGLGTVRELALSAKEGGGEAICPRVNSHIHLPPNFSAFETVAQAVALASEQKVGVVGVSNYYDFDVYGEFVSLAKRHGIFPLFGLEIIALIDELVKAGVKINDPGNPGKMYICGKGITKFGEMSEQAKSIMTTIRTNDSQRMAKMIGLLAEIFKSAGVDTGLDEDAVKEMIVRRHKCSKNIVYIQERHVAQAFQEAFFRLVPMEPRAEQLGEHFGGECKCDAQNAVKVQNEIRSNLMKAGKRGFVQEMFVDFDQAYRLILELGGVPCYPTLADGVLPMCGFEEPVEKLIENVKSRNIYCLEFIPGRNTPEVLSRYVKAIREAGLVVLGGTEHNSLDLIPIEPACVKGAAVPEEIKEIFREGACVMAAHQFLTLHGEVGFVDASGEPNGKYTTAEERISAFKALGAAVIGMYGREDGA